MLGNNANLKFRVSKIEKELSEKILTFCLLFGDYINWLRNNSDISNARFVRIRTHKRESWSRGFCGSASTEGKDTLSWINSSFGLSRRKTQDSTTLHPPLSYRLLLHPQRTPFSFFLSPTNHLSNDNQQSTIIFARYLLFFRRWS